MPEFVALLAMPERAEGDIAYAAIRSAEGTGRPLGNRAFALERRLARPLAPQARPSAEGVGSRREEIIPDGAALDG